MPVADAVWQVDEGVAAQREQRLVEERRSRDAISVEVAKDGDGLALLNAFQHTVDGNVHLRKEEGVVQGVR